MLWRMALLALLGMASACNAPPDSEPAQPAAPQLETPPALSKERIAELTGQCEKKSREQFRRDWKDGGAPAQDGQAAADFASHYNAKLDTCFYLLTVKRSADAVNLMLFDINDGEQYGEYLGPPDAGSPQTGMPATCRIESMYCASRREWEVLASSFMED
ncbi:MAG TPA: hypothetical protein VIF38_09725 [Burkholderiales bacterium]|jgi:hypothetical protein